NIQRCHYGDSKCIIESMNRIIGSNPKGIPAIGMKPVDVVDISDSEILADNPSGPVWIKLRMFEQVNYGFENTTITAVHGFTKDPTSSWVEIHGEIPSLVHKGRYVVCGRFWYFTLNSTGESVSDFQNFKFALKLKVIMEYRNNKRHLKMYKLVPRVQMDRWILWLDDFFPENFDLTIALNKVINQNWVEIWNELEPSALNVFQGVFTHLIEDVFQNVSYDDLFLEDVKYNHSQ
ncbi:hypothetical protein KR009_012325, partial [Drosophila setifemur]